MNLSLTPTTEGSEHPTASEKDALRWYRYNAMCEKTGSTWNTDDGQEAHPPLIVDAQDSEGVRFISGRYGRLERRLAYCLSQLLRRPALEPLDLPQSGLEGLGGSQIQALRMMASEGFCAVIGGPGTGKTTIARRLAALYPPAKVLGLSPTGKGADRLSESIGIPCMTIHRACWQSVPFGEYSLIVIDEAGMLATDTAEMLFRHLHKTMCRIVVMGDTGQLPSVGPGRVLDDLLMVIPYTKLLLTYRFSDADIGQACELARCGKLHIADTDVYSITEGDRQEAWVQYCRMLRLFGPHDTRVLTHRREDAQSFNRLALWHKVSKGQEPVVCKRNNYRVGVFNGQTGIHTKEGLIFDGKLINPWAIVWNYAFASTVHGAQGGQWDGVIVWTPHARHISREWLLTGASRASKRLRIIAGDLARLEESLSSAKPASKRLTLLSGFVNGETQYGFHGR